MKNSTVEEIIGEVIELNRRWKYTLDRALRRYHIDCAAITLHDLYDMSVDVPSNEEWFEWLYGSAQYWQYWQRIDVYRYDGRAVLRLYVSSPQGIATMIRLATCSCGSCEYIRRNNAPLPTPPPTSCHSTPELRGRNWQIVWCGDRRYALHLSPDAIIESLAEALIAASEYGLTPLTYHGRYSIDLRNDELTIRIAKPVPPRAAGYLYAAAADIAWSWRFAPNVVLYDSGLEIVTRITTYILGAPNIHGISRLLYAADAAASP